MNYKDYSNKRWPLSADVHPWIELQKRDGWFLLEKLVVQDNFEQEFKSIISKSLDILSEETNY